MTTTTTKRRNSTLDVGDVWTLLEDCPGSFLPEDVGLQGVTAMTGDALPSYGDDEKGGQ